MVTGAGQLVAGRYRLLASLGRGGMGVVWHAHDDVLGRDVAVKEVLCAPGLSSEDKQLLSQRTVREARAAARLNHPAAVTVFDVIEEAGRPWIVMELVRSRSLAQAVQEDGPLEPWQAAWVGLQVLEALTAAHAAGILHRDVKPGNVLLAADGRAVLTDFGIATLDGDAALTASGAVIGSPAYIAPERALGGPAAPASDMWSLGVTLYAAVEGRTPFERGGAVPTLLAVATEEPDPTDRAGPLAAVLEGLLRRDPAKRLSADDAGRLLRGVAVGRVAISPPGPAAISPPGPAAVPPPGPAAMPPPGPLGTGQLPIPGTGGQEHQSRKSLRRRSLLALPLLVAIAVIGLIAALQFVPGRTGSSSPHLPTPSPGAARREAASSSGPGTAPTRAPGSAGRTPPFTAPLPSPGRRGHLGPSQGPTPKEHNRPQPKKTKEAKKPKKPKKNKKS